MAEFPAVAVLGPTGSGKSSLALVLAQRTGGEIVNCDALQVYRGMNVGTAKSTAEERTSVPHHVLDLCEPGEDFSAGDYLRAARAALAEIRDRSRLPIVCGGTGFYFRALVEGLFGGPGRSEELRARMRRIIAAGGACRLHRSLARIDPEAAARIAPADSARILRAYEVFLLTGTPVSQWWKSHPTERLSGYRWLRLGVAWPRAELYRRIDERARRMFAEGLEEEVVGLLSVHPPDCHAFKAIGYREAAAVLRGDISRQEAISRTQQESRRYAKRQLTWFRRDSELIWLDASRGWDQVLTEADALVDAHIAGSGPVPAART